MNTSSAAHIKPTVGRVVWYYPPTNAAETGFARPEDGIPCAAIIARVWSDACVNLTVFDACGAAHPRTSVRLVQDGAEPPEHAGHCEWMPFQKGQAKAQEQLPAHASFPMSVRVGPYSDAELARVREEARPGGVVVSHGAVTHCDFGDAIRHLKEGGRVAREGWNGKGMWLCRVDWSQYQVNEVEHLAESTPRPLPWIGMRTADNAFVPWLASQTDMLAEDWVLVG